MKKLKFHWQQERKKEKDGWKMKAVWMNYGMYEITYY
jgi:hypothetical protein